jgi:hypothetical protein
MSNAHAASNMNLPSPLAAAARFWEPRRLVYNLILTVIVILWLVATWPHFRTALTLPALGAMIVLALLANLCYCAAYLPDLSIQHLLPAASWQRSRWALWLLGTLFAILLENYWIADEIYPDAGPAAPNFSPQINAVTHIASNMNFPAPLAVIGFLAASTGLFLSLAAILVAWFVRKPKFARSVGMLLAIGAVVYFALLFSFSLGSHATTLARGQEKYFCEIDCHLAYSIVDVKTEPGRYLVTLRTRFDETTTSSSRPKDAPLTPSLRQVVLIDDNGDEYLPATITGTPLLTPLKPTDSYNTQLEFSVPGDAKNLRLLINTQPGWPDHLIIGDENSWLHQKTYLAL